MERLNSTELLCSRSWINQYWAHEQGMQTSVTFIGSVCLMLTNDVCQSLLGLYNALYNALVSAMFKASG